MVIIIIIIIIIINYKTLPKLKQILLIKTLRFLTLLIVQSTL
jgi:hypothetical protein